jgi:hypothetical protein
MDSASQQVICAAGVTVSTTSLQEAGAGSIPSAALHDLSVSTIPMLAAKEILERHHYLHSLPGGTKLCFGVFNGQRLMGALTLGAGPALAYSLVEGAKPEDCLTLSRLWLSDELPANSESRVISIVLRALKKNTTLKFLISYADPSQGHIGTIYQATGWLYTGLSSAMPLYDMGDGIQRHSRSVSYAFGSHSTKYFAEHGINVKLIAQSQKHRYLYFLDPQWRARLKGPVLPYPKKEVTNGN